MLDYIGVLSVVHRRIILTSALARRKSPAIINIHLIRVAGWKATLPWIQHMHVFSEKHEHNAHISAVR